jgi:NAD(P)-dependent dehydrogenase (short-subunit alcohol dehydrogenase family)
MEDLQGHVALVTGGSSGLGLAMVHALHEAGASVAFCSRHGGRNQTAIKSLSSTGGAERLHGMVCDVIEEDQVDAMFAQVAERFGSIDSVFANAGVGGPDVPFVDADLNEWRDTVRVNLQGTFLTMRAATRHMMKAHGGSIVVTSSSSTVAGRPRGQAYAAGKAGATAMVRGLAVEVARHGIRVNAILPGWFNTSLTHDFLSAEVAQKKVLPRIPMRRWGSERDIGGVAVFLASDASRYMTGQTLTIDGGYQVG